MIQLLIHDGIEVKPPYKKVSLVTLYCTTLIIIATVYSPDDGISWEDTVLFNQGCPLCVVDVIAHNTL